MSPYTFLTFPFFSEYCISLPFLIVNSPFCIYYLSNLFFISSLACLWWCVLHLWPVSGDVCVSSLSCLWWCVLYLWPVSGVVCTKFTPSNISIIVFRVTAGDRSWLLLWMPGAQPIATHKCSGSLSPQNLTFLSPQYRNAFIAS